MKKKKRKKLIRLLKQWTRAEIIARHGEFDNLGFGQYAILQYEKADRIRKLLYGSSNLLDLGLEWGLLKKRKSKKHRRLDN